MDLIAPLARRQLVVVTGKGGVGKTAVAAVLGRCLAARGRRVLVVEVDPRENLHQMLGVPPTGGEILRAADRLWVQNLKPRQVLDAVVRERLKVELLVRRVLASPIYHHFSEGAPGLSELAILGHALRLLRGLDADAPELDTVILDAPATGHGIRLLASPLLVSEVIRNGPFADMARELAAFLADPGPGGRHPGRGDAGPGGARDAAGARRAGAARAGVAGGQRVVSAAPPGRQGRQGRSAGGALAAAAAAQ